MARIKVAGHTQGGFVQARFPAIVRTASRGLLVMWEAQLAENHCAREHRHAALFFSRSFDNGLTWSEPVRFEDPGMGEVPSRPAAGQLCEESLELAGLHNPSFLLDHVTGRLFCFYTRCGLDGSLSLLVSNTDDDGETWAHRDVTSMIIGGRDLQMAWVPRGRGTQLSGGIWSQRLAHAGVVVDSSGDHQAVFIGSDDQGVTWWSSQPVGHDVDYCSVVQSADPQKVYLLMKSRDSGEKRWATSADGGRTFDEPSCDVESSLIDLMSPLEQVFPGACPGTPHADAVTYIGEKKFCSGDCTALMLSTDDARSFVPAAWFDAKSYSSVDVVSLADQGFFAIVSAGPSGIMCESLPFKNLPLAKLMEEWVAQS